MRVTATRPSAVRLGRRLIGVGGALVAVSALASLLVTPDRVASLPWVIVAVTGSVVLFAALGLLRPGLRGRLAPGEPAVHAVRSLQLVLSFAVLLTFVFATNWPTYKLSWLGPVYAALPSVRSFSDTWMALGIQPNQAGGVLATFVGFAFAILLIPGTRGRRWPSALLACGGLAVVFLTGSRIALAGVAGAVLMLLIVRDRRWLWLAMTLVVLLVVLAAVWPASVSPLSQLLFHDESLDTKLVARLDIWASALRGIEDHAFTGIGLGVFNEVMPFRYPYESVGLSYSVSQAHNLFLDVALTLGLPGLAGLLLLLAGMAILIRHLVQTPLGSSVRPLAYGFLAAILVFLVFGVTDSLSFSTPAGLLLWLWASSLAVLALFAAD